MKLFKKYLKSLWLLPVAIGLSACGGGGEETSGAEFREAESGTSLLWKISGNGLEEPSFLFGTIHLIPKDDFFTGAAIEKAITESRTLVMEVADINDLGASMGVTSKILLDSGTIADHIDSTRFRLLLAAVEKHMGLDSVSFMKQFGRMKPFGLYTITMQMEDITSKDMKSYEKYFMERAFHHDLPMDGLESIDFQMSLFEKISFEDAVDMLLAGFEEKGADGGYTEMVEVYKKNDLDTMLEMMTSSGDLLMDNNREDFLDGRNKAWIPRIEKLIQQGPCFIAVGAAHLPGEQGVIQLLRKQGYDITPLELD
jgi:hypothetical protein